MKNPKEMTNPTKKDIEATIRYYLPTLEANRVIASIHSSTQSAVRKAEEGGFIRGLNKALEILPKPARAVNGADSYRETYRLGQMEYEFEARKAIFLVTNSPKGK